MREKRDDDDKKKVKEIQEVGKWEVYTHTHPQKKRWKENNNI